MTGDSHVMSVANMNTAGGHDWRWPCDYMDTTRGGYVSSHATSSHDHVCCWSRDTISKHGHDWSMVTTGGDM